MERWFGVDRDVLNQPRDVQIASVTVSEYISPYAIPAAIVMDADAERGVNSIRFVYISDEKSSRGYDIEPGIEVEIGRTSGRILRITLRQSAIREGETWTDLLMRAIERFRDGDSGHPPIGRGGNGRAVAGALEQNMEQLTTALVAR